MNEDRSDISASVPCDEFSTENHVGSSKKRRRKVSSSRSIYSAPVEAESSLDSFFSPSKQKSQNSSVPSLQTQSREESLDDNNCASRSKLFAATESNRDETGLNLNCDGTTSNSNDELSQDKDNKEPSLFGNVMKNVSASLGFGTSFSSFPKSMGPPTTPARSQPPLFSASPGGFQLLDFVNGFGNSPLLQRFSKTAAPLAHAQTPDPLHRQPLNSFKSPRPSVVPQTFATPRREVEWHECSMSEQWMTDWSLKSMIEIQSHPQIPYRPEEYLPSALQQFVNGGKSNRAHSTNDDDDLTAALMDFHTALCYWQHPSVHPLPNDFFASSGSVQSLTLLKSDSAMNKRKSTACGDGGNSNSSNSSSRHAMPPPKKNMRAFSATNKNATVSNQRDNCNSNEAFLQLRAKEWQSSFQSLYRLWEQTIYKLNAEWMRNRAKGEDVDNADMIKKVSETYFYAIGKGHTILFRVGAAKSKGNDVDTNESETTLELVPEIVVSSSSQSLRTKLRSMGVELSMLYDWNGHTGVFEEEWLLGSKVCSTGNGSSLTGTIQSTDVTASPNVLAELVAIRRAQMCGWNVGADVAVSLQPKNAHRQGFNGISPKHVPPLLISGTDQCAIFSTIYCNALGHMGITSFDRPIQARDLSFDVPLLLSRKLGPFLHGSIQSVIPYQRERHTTNDPPIVQTTIEGCLLPCAVRDLVCATIAFASAHEASAKTKIIAEHPKADQRKESHHFVVKLSAHPGEELKALNSTGIIGAQSSKWFNGQWSLFTGPFVSQIGIPCCQQDELICTVVWDVSHPGSVAIKLDHLTTFGIN